MESEIFNSLLDNEEITKLKSAIDKKSYPVAIYGLSESPKSHISYLAYSMIPGKSLIVTYSQSQAMKLYQDIRFFSNDGVMVIPSREVMLHNVDAQSNEATYQRLEVIESLCRDEKKIIISTIDALLTLMPPLDIYRKSIMKITLGEAYNLEQLISRLTYLGYQRVELIEAKGQFAVRGGILDIFPSTTDGAYRIEFFDEEVDSIRRLDILTQRSHEKVQEISIFAAKEIILTNQELEEGCCRIKESFHRYKTSLGNKKKRFADILEQRINETIEKILHQHKHTAIYNFIQFFYPNHTTIFEYFNDKDMIFIDELARIKERHDEFTENLDLNYTTLFDKGEVLPEQRNIIIDYDHLLKILASKKVILSSVFLKNDKDLRPKSIISFSARVMQAFHGKIDILIDELTFWKRKKYIILLLAATKDKAQRLIASLNNRGIEAVFLEDRKKPLHYGQISVMVGSVSKGFEYPTMRFALVTDQEVYGAKALVKSKDIKKPKDKDRIKLFSELKVGDFVVHENHGIGQYMGIEQLKVQGVKKDYLNIRYYGNDKLYLPTEQLHLIQKYIGSEAKTPKLSKLGGT